MSRKILIIAISSFLVLLLALYGLYYFYFTSNETDPLRFVPAEAAVVIETPSLKNLTKRLKNDNEIWQNIKGFSFMKTNSKVLAGLDSLFGVMSEFEKLNENKKTVLFLLEVEKSPEVVVLLPLSNLTDEKNASKFFKKLIKDTPDLERKELDGATIYRYKYGKKKKKFFYFSLKRGMIVGTSSFELIKEGFPNSNFTKSILDDNVFRRVNATKSKTADAHIFVNFQALTKLAEPSLRNKLIGEKLEQFVHWSVADFQASSQSISLTGFSLPEPNKDYLSTLVHQSPVKITPSDVLPSNTDAFLSLGLENTAQYFTDYHDVLDMHNQLPTQMVEVEKIETCLNNIVDKEVTLAFVKQAVLSNQARSVLAAIRLKDPKTTSSQLSKIATINLIDSLEVKSKWFRIYSFEEKNMFYKVFGDLFRESASSFFAISDQYAYFANSISTLKTIVSDVKNGNTLSSNEAYSNLSATLTSQCNFYAYLSPSSACDMVDYVFSKNTAQIFTQNYKIINKLGGMVLQLSSNKEMVYHNLVLINRTDERKNTKQLWVNHLEGSVLGTPQAFDLGGNEKVIFVSDIKGNSYLLDSDGETIWKKHLGRLMGRVQTMDYFKNGKTQFLFNTKDKIHLIDKNGNEVAPYPLRLKSEASNGISIFDYDNKKDYRLFIACENKKVICLDKSGNLVEGWNAPISQQVVRSEITHSIIEAIDYICYSSNNQVFILDRKGNSKIEISEPLQFADNHQLYLKQTNSGTYWVSNLKDGRICSIRENGKIQYLNLKKSPKDYYFSLIKDTNNKDEYLLSMAYQDKLEVYDSNHDQLFDYSFKGKISSPPVVIEVDGESKLAVSTASEGKIYLFNLNGSLYRGFPFNGTGSFSIVKLGNKEARYNILVGDNLGNLVCYVLD